MRSRLLRHALGVPLLLATVSALVLATLPLPRSTAIAPVGRQAAVAVAAAPAPSDQLAGPQRWPHVGVQRPRALAGEHAAQLQAALERARSTFGVYGAQIAVSWDGSRTWSGASGVMRDGRTRLGVDQPMVIGSVTKTFTAALVLQLAEEGRISLDASVAGYLPALALDPRITVRELLSHTSGLADFYHPLAKKLLSQPDRVWTSGEVLGRIGRPWFEPGADWAYSNTNYVVLGLLAEAVSGETAARLLAERLLGPLDLDHTRLTTGGTLLDPSWATAFWTAGAMCSTASDLVRWGDALYGGSVLKPASLRQMLAFNDDDYGLGARRMTFGSHEAVGHNGMLATYTAIVLHFPAERVTVALLVNRSEVDLPAMLAAEVGGQPSLLDLILEQ
jgi:D-alanyl-D-alanine carboxypeptidase